MNLQCIQELWVNSQEGEGDVGRSAAVIFGVPTCVGNMSWQVKKWLGTNWNVQVGGKLGSAFSTDNSPNGGERQKVSIARALAQQAPVLLFDEPTSNLDIKNQLDVLDITRQVVRRQNLAAVVIIHDLNLALRFADKFLVMKDGAVFAFGGKAVVNAETIRQVYGVHAQVVEYDGRPVVIPQ